MNKDMKKLFLSMLTGIGISFATAGCRYAFNRTIPAYYSVNFSKEVTGASVSLCDNEVLNHYPSLASSLVDDNVKVYQNGNMVSQGITLTDDYILTSCYDADGNDNSIVVTLDKGTGKLVNVCELDNDAHVGGIAYDKERDLVWISGKSGEVNAYSTDNIIKQYQTKPIYAKLDVGNGLKNYQFPWLNSVASLCVYDNQLYVGSFQSSSPGIVKKYNIKIDENDKKLYLTYDREFTIPSMVQGISFYNNGENTYLLLSRSFGRHMSSIIQIFKYDEATTDYTKNVPYIYFKAPTMLEQITAEDDSLYTIFESAAKKYENGREQVDEICVFDLPKLTKKL